ncbi:hypothetical protein HPP92_012247 [Vanilla planifolia]|uniref:Thylakoid soluble phosphoprotein TSP9 n=1 Tax=Vanilla planifolia TaxID=51239 RepID=A0A835V4A6_VANPL|nr:hypothetical protein HPP92_012634 [Vanilla planifolia]KAG0484163.1 hypothetical protein HPP92_012247 [Vanilla planifolia]
MASLSMPFGVAPVLSGRVFQATATTKNAGGNGEQKGLVDWILGGLQKEDQLLETDPILKKVKEKSGNGTRRKSTTSVSVPSTKKPNDGSGGSVFGGLFAKK